MSKYVFYAWVWGVLTYMLCSKTPCKEHQCISTRWEIERADESLGMRYDHLVKIEENKRTDCVASFFSILTMISRLLFWENAANPLIKSHFCDQTTHFGIYRWHSLKTSLVCIFAWQSRYSLFLSTFHYFCVYENDMTISMNHKCDYIFDKSADKQMNFS